MHIVRLPLAIGQQIPKPTIDLPKVVPGPVSDVPLPDFEKLFGLNLIVHGSATLHQVLEHANQEIGHAHQDLPPYPLQVDGVEADVDGIVLRVQYPELEQVEGPLPEREILGDAG